MWTSLSSSSRGNVAAVFPFPALTDARKPRWQWGHCVSLEGSKHAEIIYDLHGGDDLQAVYNDLLVGSPSAEILYTTVGTVGNPSHT